MSGSEDSSIGSDDAPAGVTSVHTATEMMVEGLKLAGLDETMQAKQPKSNPQDCVDRHGSKPGVLAAIWIDLQATACERARVPADKLKLDFFHMTHHFLKQCPMESERRLAHLKVSRRKHTQQDWVWHCVEKIWALKHEKIHIPQDHIDGDDVWIATLDGTMFKSWEIAGMDKAKDPDMFSFKHHVAGFNAEVAVSVKESRCLG